MPFLLYECGGRPRPRLAPARALYGRSAREVRGLPDRRRRFAYGGARLRRFAASGGAVLRRVEGPLGGGDGERARLLGPLGCRRLLWGSQGQQAAAGVVDWCYGVGFQRRQFFVVIAVGRKFWIQAKILD